MQTLTLKNTQQRTTLSQCHSGFSLINNLNQAIEHTLSDLDTPNGVQLATLQRLYNRVTPLVYAIMRTQDGFHGTFTTPAPEKKVLYGPESANAYYQSLLTEGYLSTSEQHAAEWLPSSENHIDTQDLRRVQQLVYGWMYQHNQNTSCAAMRTSQHDMIAAFMQARQGQPAPLTIIGPEQPPTATLYYDETLGDFAIQTVAASTPHTVATYAVDSSQQHAQVACVSKTRRAARPVPKTPQSRSRHRKKTSTKASKTIVFRSAHKQKAATHNTIAFSKRGAATRRAHTPARAMCFLNHNDSLHKLTAQRIAPLCSALRQYAALGLVHMDIPAELSALLHSSASTYRNAILRATEAPLLAQGSDYKSVCALTNPLAFPTDTGSAAWRATHMRFLNATNHQAAWLYYFTHGIHMQTAQPHQQSYALLLALYDAFCKHSSARAQRIAQKLAKTLSAYCKDTLLQLGIAKKHTQASMHAWNTRMNRTYAGHQLERIICTHALEHTTQETLHTAIDQYEEQTVLTITRHAHTMHRRLASGLHAKRQNTIVRIQRQTYKLPTTRQSNKQPGKPGGKERTVSNPGTQPHAWQSATMLATTHRKHTLVPAKPTPAAKKTTPSAKDIVNMAKKTVRKTALPIMNLPLSFFKKRAWSLIRGGKKPRKR